MQFDMVIMVETCSAFLTTKPMRKETKKVKHPPTPMQILPMEKRSSESGGAREKQRHPVTSNTPDTTLERKGPKKSTKRPTGKEEKT